MWSRFPPKWIAVALAGVAAAVVPSAARASIPGEARSPVHYEYHQSFCGADIDYDTGWIPDGYDEVQVRMQFRFNCSFGAALDGEGVMTWPPSMQLHFEGEPRGGEFTESIGVFFDTRIRWNILGSSGESSIPFIPTIDLGCLDRRVQFTPFMLSGNPARPARINCEIPRFTVFEYDLFDLLAPELTLLVSAWIRVHIQINMYSYFQGNKIMIDEHDQEITEEYGRAYIYPRGAPAMDLTAQYIADLSHQIVVTIYPEVEIDVFGFSLFGFTIGFPVPVTEITDQWIFDPAEMSFYFPDIDVERTLDFGRTQVDRPRLKRFEVQNVGFQDLLVRPRTALPFGVDDGLTLEIGAPGMDDMVVSFDPEGVGRATGVLRLQTNDPDEPWVDVQLLGEATTDEVPPYDDDDDCPSGGCPPRTYDDSSGLGCGCSVAGGSAVPSLAALAAVLGLALLRRRR